MPLARFSIERTEWEAVLIRGALIRGLRLLASASLPLAMLAACEGIPHVNATTSGLLLVLLIVGIAGWWGAAEALTGAIAGGIGFDYLFLPPRGLALENPEHLVALVAFMVTAVTSGLLFSRAKQRQVKAQERRDEIEKLFRLGNVVMECHDSATTPQRLTDCLAELFHLDGVILFDGNADQVARSGVAGTVVPDTMIREIAARAKPLEESSDFFFTPLRNGEQIVGSLGIRGARLSQSVLLPAAGRVGMALAKVHAIEKAAQAEAIRRSEELKAAVLDALAHEIRSPLSSIKIAVTTLLSAQAQKEGTREMLAIIEEEGDRLNSLIDDTILMSRLEAGTLELDKQPQDVQALVSGAVEEMLARDTGRRLEVHIAPSLPPLLCDARMVGKALKLLLDNAVKYSPPGSPVTVLAERSADSIVLSVTNEGPGIPENEQKLIFEKYYRGRSGRSHVTGTGLGLPSARTIVEAHSGRLSVSSPPGGGVTFQIAVPLAEERSLWAT